MVLMDTRQSIIVFRVIILASFPKALFSLFNVPSNRRQNQSANIVNGILIGFNFVVLSKIIPPIWNQELNRMP